MDNTRNIELELRSVVASSDYDRLLGYLQENTTFLSRNRRLSVMFHGQIGQESFDIRVRTKNDGQAEVVLKKGQLHAHDRQEFSQAIDRGQFVGFVKIFAALGLQCKVTERENYNFSLAGDVTLSLVRSGDIAYLEIEKMSAPNEVEENRKLLEQIADELNTKLISSDQEFYDLCKSLDAHDWFFDHSEEHHLKLGDLLTSYEA